MARLNQAPPNPVSPLRLLAIMVFLISISGGLVYLFAMPLKQVYWGGERLGGAKSSAGGLMGMPSHRRSQPWWCCGAPRRRCRCRKAAH